MTTDNLRINNYPLISITEFNVLKAPNIHPTLSLQAGLAGSDVNRLIENIQQTESIHVTATSPEGVEYTIFTGIPEKSSIAMRNEAAHLTLTAIGHSAANDMKPKIRVFQNKKMTYSKMFSHLSTGSGSYIIPENSDKEIGSLLVQYNETDWEYAKRIASRLGTVVIPDCTLDSSYLSIGVPRNMNSYDVTLNSFTVEKDIQEYWRLRNNGLKSIGEQDVTSYIYKSRAPYNLCDRVVINGISTLVYKVNTHLEGNMIYHTYTLREKDGFQNIEYFNEQIIGASINGTVKAIEDDMVKVELDYDISEQGRKWFAYSTPYSSPDGTGWYFMPEEGDEIRLHFLTQKEKDAYVISSTHVTHGDRSNPEVKFIRTKRGQSITFNPDSIHITDGKGSHIVMDKAKGIEMKTDKSICMSAGDNIQMNASGKINILGDKGVQIRQGDSLIQVDETIDITAGHVRVQ